MNTPEIEQDLSGLKSSESNANVKDEISTVEDLDTTGLKQAERDEKGRLLPGNTANPNGRPKGKFSLKTRIIQKLEENPEQLEDVIKFLIENERALLFQMIDGRPSQGIGQADDLEKLNVGVVILPSKNENTVETTT